MRFNPEFLSFLSDDFGTSVREVIAERLQFPVSEIPVFQFDDEVPGEQNSVSSFGNTSTLIRTKAREDGTVYAMRVNPSAIKAQAELFLAQTEQISGLATKYAVSTEEIRASLIQGAGFDVVVRSLLQAVNSTADDDEFVTVRELAKTRIGLESRSSQE